MFKSAVPKLYLYEGNRSVGEHRMQVLGQQHSILNIINPGNWRWGVITNRTIVEDRQNVLEQNIIEGSHR